MDFFIVLIIVFIIWLIIIWLIIFSFSIYIITKSINNTSQKNAISSKIDKLPNNPKHEWNKSEIFMSDEKIENIPEVVINQEKWDRNDICESGDAYENRPDEILTQEEWDKRYKEEYERWRFYFINKRF